MKKGTFYLRLIEAEPEEVSGYVSKFFGIQKVEKIYAVTHLRTGLAIAVFPLLSKARSFVAALENGVFPASWDYGSFDSDLADISNHFAPNGALTIALKTTISDKED